jgi:hypothetical protein
MSHSRALQPQPDFPTTDEPFAAVALAADEAIWSDRILELFADPELDDV